MRHAFLLLPFPLLLCVGCEPRRAEAPPVADQYEAVEANIAERARRYEAEAANQVAAREAALEAEGDPLRDAEAAANAAENEAR